MNQKPILFIIIVMTVLALSSCSPEFEELPITILENGLYYVLLADNTYKVEGTETGIITHLEIPSSINGRPVSIIGKYAFENWGMETVSIPDTIVTIGDYAFQRCDNLQSITIPSSVKSIGSYAFAYCNTLSNITLSDGLEIIGRNAFYQLGNDADFDTLIIPDTVKTIQDYAFYTFIKSIYIPDSVSYIGNMGFLSKVRTSNPDYDLTIYCEHETQPEEWDTKWASDNYGVLNTDNVVWGYVF